MQFSKKTIACALVVVALALSVAATASAAPIEISYMAWYNTTQSEADQVQATMDRFNASQDKIHVSLIIIPRDGYETKVNTMAAGKQLPDTTELSEAMALEFASAGLLADVSTMYPADNAPLKSLAFTYNGKPVGYSSGNEVLLLYYNKKLFDAAKLPYPPASADKAWTWQQYVDVAKKLTKDKNGKTRRPGRVRRKEHRAVRDRFRPHLVDVAHRGGFQRRRAHEPGREAAPHRQA